MERDEMYEDGLAAAREWQSEGRDRHDAEPAGNRLLHELAEESDGRLVEISPGCFYESKIPFGGLS